MVDMRVDIGGLELRNPVMPASGTFADGLDKAVDFERLGAMVIKTITRELRVGNALPRVCETPEGMLNSIGIPSKGMPYFHGTTVPTYTQFKTSFVVSISAPTVDGFASLAEEVSLPGVAAIEANISCPNLEEDGKAFANQVASAVRATAAVRAATQLPLWVKLSPNVGDIVEIARAVEDAGADALNYILLRLPLEVKPLFEEWLETYEPLKKERVMAAIRSTRGGRAYRSRWHERMSGTGQVADLIRQRFAAAVKRAGLKGAELPKVRTDLFVPPSGKPADQLTLF